jgi:hypothetical protein
MYYKDRRVSQPQLVNILFYLQDVNKIIYSQLFYLQDVNKILYSHNQVLYSQVFD